MRSNDRIQMESVITAPVSGHVKRVLVQEGESFYGSACAVFLKEFQATLSTKVTSS